MDLDVDPDVVRVRAEMAAAVVNTRGTDNNTGTDIQTDRFDR